MFFMLTRKLFCAISQQWPGRIETTLYRNDPGFPMKIPGYALGAIEILLWMPEEKGMAYSNEKKNLW